MCGIAGIISTEPIRVHELSLMAEALQHRGPNGNGFALALPGQPARVRHNAAFNDGERATVGFAHRRLAIFDLSDQGLQPMHSADEQLTLCFNGAIYNFRELRKELESLGHRFHTESDTEVILAAYDQWGADCVTRFVGMWAFALYDARRRELVLSRDRFGIKPLYLATRGRSIYFASEIKGLLAVPGLRGEPDAGVVSLFMQTGLLDTDERTFFEGIRAFPAAHTAVFSLTDHSLSPRLSRYWSVPTDRFEGTDAQGIAALREQLFEAVRSHSLSDVAVGTCLSGGLDSSSIVCMASDLRSNSALDHYAHRSYGYLPSDPSVSEQRFMEIVAARTGTTMEFIRCTDAQFTAQLPGVLAAQDEPFGSSSIAVQYLVFQRARETGITVMLDGQGADETLGGYHHFLPTLGWHFLATRRLREYLKLRLEYPRYLGARFPIDDRVALGMLLPPGIRKLAKRVMRPAASGGTGAAVQQPFSDALRAAAPSGAALWAPTDGLNAILELQVKSLCMPALLRYEDRNSMAHSIESRVPFLDHRLVELAFRLPPELKIRGARTKFALREAMRGVLPEQIRDRRDKLGFRATPALTFDLVRRNADWLLSAETPYEREWIDANGLRELVSREERTSDREFMLWRMFNLKAWLRSHWGSERPEPVELARAV